MKKFIEVVAIQTGAVVQEFDITHHSQHNADKMESGINRNMSDDFYTRQVERAPIAINQEAADLKVELANAKEANSGLLVQLGAARVLLTRVVDLHKADCIVRDCCWAHDTSISFDGLAEEIKAALTP